MTTDIAPHQAGFQALKRVRGLLAGVVDIGQRTTDIVSSPQAGTRPASLCCSNPSPSTRATFQVYGSSMGTSLGIVILLIWIRQGCRPVDTPYLPHIGTARLGKAH